MNNIVYKKTFWMNIGLSLFFTLGLFMFLFLNIDYVESRPSEKIMNVFLFIVPILSMITFYKNGQGLLLKLTLILILNIGVLVLVCLFTLRSLYHQSWDSVIFMLILMTPFLFNVKQLIKLQRIK